MFVRMGTTKLLPPTVVLAMVLAMSLAVTTPVLGQSDHFNVTDNGVLSYGGDVVLGKCGTLRRSDTFPQESMQQKAARACEKAGFPLKGTPTSGGVESHTPLTKTGGPPIILVPIALIVVCGFLIRKSTAL